MSSEETREITFTIKNKPGMISFKEITKEKDTIKLKKFVKQNSPFISDLINHLEKKKDEED